MTTPAEAALEAIDQRCERCLPTLTCRGCGSQIDPDDPDAYTDPEDMPACSWSCRQEAFELARGGL